MLILFSQLFGLLKTDLLILANKESSLKYPVNTTSNQLKTSSTKLSKQQLTLRKQTRLKHKAA